MYGVFYGFQDAYAYRIGVCTVCSVQPYDMLFIQSNIVRVSCIYSFQYMRILYNYNAPFWNLIYIRISQFWLFFDLGIFQDRITAFVPRFLTYKCFDLRRRQITVLKKTEQNWQQHLTILYVLQRILFVEAKKTREIGENLKTKQRSFNEKGRQVKLTEQQFARIFNDTYPSERVSSSKGPIVRRFPDTRKSNEKSYEQHFVSFEKQRNRCEISGTKTRNDIQRCVSYIVQRGIIMQGASR